MDGVPFCYNAFVEVAAVEAKAKAAARVICELEKSKRYLHETIKRAEKYRMDYRRFSYLKSVRDMMEWDQARIARFRREIEGIEAAIASISDDLDRRIVSMRAQGKSWAAVSTALYLSEETAMRRFCRACAALIPAMREAGLIRE